jgi:hypothetical protein
MDLPRSRPISRGTDATCPTTGTAFAVPTTTTCRVVRVLLAAEAFVGFGSADTPPTASANNTVYQAAGTQDYILDGMRQTDLGYVYIYAPSGTIVAKVSFLG